MRDPQWLDSRLSSIEEMPLYMPSTFKAHYSTISTALYTDSLCIKAETTSQAMSFKACMSIYWWYSVHHSLAISLTRFCCHLVCSQYVTISHTWLFHWESLYWTTSPVVSSAVPEHCSFYLMHWAWYERERERGRSERREKGKEILVGKTVKSILGLLQGNIRNLVLSSVKGEHIYHVTWTIEPKG